MRIGIIRYPGSNCDFDTLRYFNNSFFIWHKETTFPASIDLLVIPGGFAFGDRLYNSATGDYVISPGTMAIQSPVTSIIREAAKRKIPILKKIKPYILDEQYNFSFASQLVERKDLQGRSDYH